jgi:hypothetical protein
MMPARKAAALRYRAIQQKLRMRAERMAKHSTPEQSGAGWASLGPAPLASDASGVGEFNYGWVSGRATSVAIDPFDATGNTVYIGGAYGGVWKSTNAANQNPANVVWTALTDSQATLAIGAIAIQPGGTGVLVAGTGEADSSTDSYGGLGILRSTNAGNTWALIQTDTTATRPFAGLAFSKIAFSSNSTSVAVAATAGASQGILEGQVQSATANLGLYYSTDSGNSWTYANVQDGSTATAEGSATAVAFNASADQFFAALRYHGFYSSSDGINWTRLTNQPGGFLTSTACPAQSESTTCPIYRGEISVVPGRNEMYIWFVDANDNDQGIWESTDGGNTWNQINDSEIANCGDELGCGTEDGTYNLELAAVPDGSATDLYAGAINIYKCQITSAVPDCSGTGPNTFLNLTHSEGCSSIADVHPAQHAIAFLLNSNQQDVMYFANDGGVYGALNGYTGLTTGTCGGSNAFQSLNQTLGSMTQFVSFSEPPGDGNTILGGSQGNGSPATQSAQSNAPWLNVNSGDGGYTQINPSTPDQWFVSNPPDALSGVNIFVCDSGINCHTQDFQNGQVVSSATLGGDTGPYNPVFILDPQASGEMLVGTCRMWRGPSSGGAFTDLSNSFENGGTGICTGLETNLVSSMAAGGPLDSDNLSSVIYAGTDGFGPLISTIPPGGHIWVTTNAPGGPATWVDQTGSINPENFPISGVAVDTSDPTGLTAYITIMGFNVSHVWQTTNGGVSWIDYTANLPDSPANAILVDPGSNPLTGTLDVATDVGVFSSSTASANWTEVGPAPSSGQQGYLPNVAVTALAIFNDGTDKWLRASTYGRGIWQYPLLTTPDFVMSISNTPLTVFTGTEGVFQGSIYSLDGYSSPVNLSCITGSTPPPTTCSPSPNPVTPSASGTTFIVTTSGADGTYAFNLQGSGTDPSAITHQSQLTLNIVDFALTSPSPSSITVGPAQTSKPITFQVTAAGPFSQAVSLGCSGLPSGANCNFQPSSSVDPTSSLPVSITLTISTASYTTAGTFPVTITGSVTNGPTRTQDLSLTVTKDYSITITNPTLTAYENANATYDGTLTSLNGYSSAVNLSCGLGAPPLCTVAPATVTPTPNGAPFTVTVSSPQCGQYNFNIVAQGTDSLSTTHEYPVSFTSNSVTPANYALEISNPSLSAPVNSSAIFNGTLTASICYNSPVNLSCGSGAPPTCKASPASLTPTTGGAPFTITVSSSTVLNYGFNISAVGTDPLAIQHTQLVSFDSTPASANGFTLTNNSGAESINPGQTATYNLQVSPALGTLPDVVTLTYADCPTLSLCSLSPAQVDAGKGTTSVTFTVQTTAPIVARMHSSTTRSLYALWLLLPGVVVTIAGIRHPRRRKTMLIASLALLLPLLSTFSACGSGGLQGGSTASAEPGTPAGTYTIVVTGTMNTAPGLPTSTVDLSLTVK